MLKFATLAAALALLCGCNYDKAYDDRFPRDPQLSVPQRGDQGLYVATVGTGYSIQGHNFRGLARVSIKNEPRRCGTSVCVNGAWRDIPHLASVQATATGALNAVYTPSPRLCGDRGNRKVVFAVIEHATRQGAVKEVPATPHFTGERCP